MTLVGKIFVLVITGMSFVLFGLSLLFMAKHEDWRKISLEHKEVISEIQKETQDLTAINTELTEHLNTIKGEHEKAITAVQTQTKTIEDQNVPLLTAFTKFEIDLQKKIEEIVSLNVTIDESRSMIQLLTKDEKNARQLRGAYLRDLAKTIATKNEQVSILQDITQANEELLAKYDNAKQVLDKFGLEANPEKYGNQPRFTVQGMVSDIQKDGGTNLLITVGASDGLQPGHYLEVYRGSSYIGRIMVLATEPDRSVCRILPNFRQGIIKQGDTVTSRIM